MMKLNQGHIVVVKEMVVEGGAEKIRRCGVAQKQLGVWVSKFFGGSGW